MDIPARSYTPLLALISSILVLRLLQICFYKTMFSILEKLSCTPEDF